MSGFEAVWNQPKADKPDYYISRTGFYLDQYIVNEDHGGWAISISPVFANHEQAVQFIKEYTA
jgi:hypothetical protein